MPLVTIIIPVYNVEKYLKTCLDSVVLQTYKAIEIILINDASSDHSLSIMREYEKRYKNIKIINNPINLGVSISRNLGLDCANGEYIYFLDSDDWIIKDAIEKMVCLAKLYDVLLVEANYKTKNRTNKEEKIEISYENLQKNKDFLQRQAGAVWNKLYAHSLMENLRFPENLIYEDVLVSYPVFTQIKEYVHTSEYLYFYRKNPNSITRKNRFIPNSKILDLYTILKLLKQKCLEIGTYEAYHEQIDAIIKSKAWFPLLQIALWTQIKKEDKSLILNNLYQFSQSNFFITDLNNIQEECMDFSNMRFKSIKKQILEHYIATHNTSLSSSLSPTIRTLNKYKK